MRCGCCRILVHKSVAWSWVLKYLCRPFRSEQPNRHGNKARLSVADILIRAISSGVERHVDIVEVAGSKPASPTKNGRTIEPSIGEVTVKLAKRALIIARFPKGCVHSVVWRGISTGDKHQLPAETSFAGIR